MKYVHKANSIYLYLQLNIEKRAFPGIHVANSGREFWTKNNVWIAISFSMLAAAVTAGAGQVQSSQEVDKSQIATEAHTEIDRLQIHVKPDFEKALPCYAQKK